jgi:hypothetical protein
MTLLDADRRRKGEAFEAYLLALRNGGQQAGAAWQRYVEAVAFVPQQQAAPEMPISEEARNKFWHSPVITPVEHEQQPQVPYVPRVIWPTGELEPGERPWGGA